VNTIPVTSPASSVVKRSCASMSRKKNRSGASGKISSVGTPARAEKSRSPSRVMMLTPSPKS
jgi:hypothetical protein